MIEVRCFQNLEDVSFLRAEINALNLASRRPDPFATLEFYENYLQHDQLLSESKGSRLCFLAAFAEGSLVGYIPLKHTRHRILGLRTAKLSFFAAHDVDRPQLIARPELLDAVVTAVHDYLFDHIGNWGLLEFEQQAMDSPLLRYALESAPKGYRVRTWSGWSNWSIPIQWDSLDAYYKDFSKKFRSNVGRQMRRLFAAGELEFIGSDSPAQTPALLELYLGIEPHSWKTQAGLSISGDPARIRYFEGLLAAPQPMRISILLLLLNGVPIAGLIVGAYGGGLHALQIVFDDRLSAASPGSAMLLMGMREAIIGQHRLFNLLSGFDYFKNRWLAEGTETQCAQIYRAGSPFFWRRCLGDQARRILLRARKGLPILRNPLKYAAAAPAATLTDPESAPEFLVTPEKMHRVAALIAEVRSGPCQFLTATELAAAMPFDTTAPPE